MQTAYDKQSRSTQSMAQSTVRSEEVQRRQVVNMGLLAGSALLAVTAITLWFLMVF